MTDTLPTPLTDQTLARLRAYGEGNGIAPGQINVLETQEAVCTIGGFLNLKPDLQVHISQQVGRNKQNKKAQIFASLAELKQEIEARRNAFASGEEWLAKAVEELQKTPGNGWGCEQGELRWEVEPILLSATENCPSCRGSAQAPCYPCQGLGHVLCEYCQGQGRNMCPACRSSGQDPSSPSSPCPNCQGKGWTPCTFCQPGRPGQMLCPSCQGRGYLSCPACKGAGCVTHEATLIPSATVAFVLGQTTLLPSGLLRMMERTGLAAMTKGHADTSLTVPTPESGERRDILPIQATLPYADIKIQIGERKIQIAAFGKKGKLSNVPPFLDDALKTSRAFLIKAARGETSLEKALSARALRDALCLILSGKRHPNELRRLYPVGLSANVATEIMTNLTLALKRETQNLRLGASVGLTLASGALFWLWLALSAGLWNELPRLIVPAADLATASLLAALCWHGLRLISSQAVKRRHPNATVAGILPAGKTGAAMLAGITALDLFLWVFSGRMNALF